MCQPQAFEEWKKSSAQTVEASQQQQSVTSEPAPSPNQSRNKEGYQSLFEKEDKNKTVPAPRAAEANDFPVQDTLLKNWLTNKVSKWPKLSAKQFTNLHKDLVTIYTCQNPITTRAATGKFQRVSQPAGTLSATSET
jgi:hypothetical protein